MNLLLLLLAGCSSEPPDVLAVRPAEVMPGDVLHATGRGFDEEVVGVLVQGPQRIPVPVEVQGETEVRGVVPDDLPSGTWTLQVESAGGDHGAGVAVEVWRAETEPPCSKRYALSVETSRVVKKVAVERIFPDRPATRDVFFEDDMAALELTRTPTPSGATCSAVWLIDARGVRWLVADDAERDLSPVARELASSLSLDLRE